MSVPNRLPFSTALFVLAIFPVSACRQRSPATQINEAAKGTQQNNAAVSSPNLPTLPAPYKVYQGTGNVGEEKGARVCFVFGKDEHCWDAGDSISEVTAKPIKLRSGHRLILVTALSMGGSDGTLYLAVLDEQNHQPVNLLPPVQLASSNAGQWDEWLVENISSMPIVLIADPVWSSDFSISNAEDRAAAHEFVVSAYTYNAPTAKYRPQLSYETSGKYRSGEDVLVREKGTILEKLRGAGVR